MIAILGLFETHLTVRDLQRSMKFYGEVLGLKLGHIVPERRAAFYWLGVRGGSMVGLWEAGAAPLHLSLHTAFSVALRDLLNAPDKLRKADIAPLDFWGNSTDEPVVLAWIPAAALYFRDPDGNMLEFIATLPDEPRPELEVIAWSLWLNRFRATTTHST